MSRHRFMIGIDPGVKTGFAIWDTEKKRFTCVDSDKIHDCFLRIENCLSNNMEIFVRVEDARKRKWFGNAGREQLQGAGSIKRDCSIWEDFLTSLNVAFEMVPPKNNKTKITAESFSRLTGWREKTNEHARDAAMLVCGM